MDGNSFTEVEKVILIKGCKIFAHCSDRALAKIAKIVKMIRIPGDVLLYTEDEPSHDAFIIVSGRVKLT